MKTEPDHGDEFFSEEDHARIALDAAEPPIEDEDETFELPPPPPEACELCGEKLTDPWPGGRAIRCLNCGALTYLQGFRP